VNVTNFIDPINGLIKYIFNVIKTNVILSKNIVSNNCVFF